jgi:hypothetical protein
VLKEHWAGPKTADLARKSGVSQAIPGAIDMEQA